MTNEKPGCSVSLSLVCTDEQGQVISDIPTGNWYGMDRKMANILAMDINEAVMEVVDGYNRAQFGEDYRKMAAPKSR